MPHMIANHRGILLRWAVQCGGMILDGPKLPRLRLRWTLTALLGLVLTAGVLFGLFLR